MPCLHRATAGRGTWTLKALGASLDVAGQRQQNPAASLLSMFQTGELYREQDANFLHQCDYDRTSRRTIAHHEVTLEPLPEAALP